MSTLIITAQRGEYWEFGAKLTDRVTKQPIDATSKGVTMVVRSGPKEADPLVTVDGASTGIVSAIGGDVWGGGRLSTPGTYYVTLTAGAASDGRGWPAEEMGVVKIVDRP